MSKVVPVLGRLIILAAALVFPRCATRANREELVLASYNVENLFDAVYDGSEYQAFDPGTDSWGANRYARSLENTAKVIAELGGGHGADVLALQEVENHRVLDDLATELGPLGYRYTALVANSGPFHNAVFSRYPIISVRTHALSLPEASPGRYILEVDIEWFVHPIRLFVNHWHSKAGGEAETEPARREAAAVLVRRIRETYSEGGPRVIVAGDLNVNADEYTRLDGAYSTALRPEALLGKYDPRDGIFLTSRPERSEISEAGVLLYSPWTARGEGRPDGADSGPPGTYVFRGAWNSLDHILLGPGFVGCTSGETSRGLCAGEFEVIAEPYMLTSAGAPMRWRSDRASGYSDHLPVQITLRAGEGRDRETKGGCHIHPPLSSRSSGDP